MQKLPTLRPTKGLTSTGNIALKKRDSIENPPTKYRKITVTVTRNTGNVAAACGFDTDIDIEKLRQSIKVIKVTYVYRDLALC